MKSRFCPSPTGHMHLGNVRTALFNALLAKHQQGHFLIRIEDTDQVRSQENYTADLLHDLTWLGLTWQEGPEVGGANPPYWQSQRGAIYAKYYQQLHQQGLAYSCFCSEQELAISRKLQLASGHPPRYAGGCDQMTPEAVARKLAQGLKPALRFKVPLQQIIEFEDLVRGVQRFNSNDLGDFIIRRTDGTSAFLFCNALDDALMGVTHALRGEDHLTNTPRQILLLKALGLTPPAYGHIALIVGADGSPLSKRHGSRSVQELREEGFLPQALINYLARLGHYYADNTFMDLNQLATGFATANLGTAPAHFDYQQLLHWQKEAILGAPTQTLWQWCGTSVQALIPANHLQQFIDTVRPNLLFPQDALHWANIFYGSNWPYTGEGLGILKQAGPDFFAAALEIAQGQMADYASILAHLQKNLGIKGKALFQPIRVALTGELIGPDMQHIMALLSRETLCQRLQKAQEAARA